MVEACPGTRLSYWCRDRKGSSLSLHLRPAGQYQVSGNEFVPIVQLFLFLLLILLSPPASQNRLVRPIIRSIGSFLSSRVLWYAKILVEELILVLGWAII